MITMSEPVAAVLSDVAEPKGQERKCSQHRGCALAGRSALNCLELTPLEAAEAVADHSGCRYD